MNYRVTNFEPDKDFEIYIIKDCSAGRDDIIMKLLQIRNWCHSQWEIEELPEDFKFQSHMKIYNWRNL